MHDVSGPLLRSIRKEGAMILKFSRRKVKEMVAYEKGHEPARKPYTGEGWGCEAEHARGLNLVGDRGIYLICNNSGGVAPSTSGRLAYALECNPEKQGFEDWWNVKQVAFGGDDGAEFIPLELVEQWLKLAKDEAVLWLDLTPSRYQLLDN